MDYTDYLEDAIAQVDAWNLPEAEFAEALHNQAKFLAGQDIEQAVDANGINPYVSLRF
jgi:hypothetical protein